ncbi:hypothetical protein GCM10027445_58630 [Amycolatopsis endophytica]
MGPKQRWTTVNREAHRVYWQGGRWTLRATPGHKYPWRLTNGEGVHQDIGVADLVAARAMAEFWLDVTMNHSSLLSSPTRETA